MWENYAIFHKDNMRDMLVYSQKTGCRANFHNKLWVCICTYPFAGYYVGSYNSDMFGKVETYLAVHFVKTCATQIPSSRIK